LSSEDMMPKSNNVYKSVKVIVVIFVVPNFIRKPFGFGALGLVGVTMCSIVGHISYKNAYIVLDARTYDVYATYANDSVRVH
jgi:uncharacterized membrane protein